jgi:hypothetical protein
MDPALPSEGPGLAGAPDAPTLGWARAVWASRGASRDARSRADPPGLLANKSHLGAAVKERPVWSRQRASSRTEDQQAARPSPVAPRPEPIVHALRVEPGGPAQEAPDGRATDATGRPAAACQPAREAVGPAGAAASPSGPLDDLSSRAYPSEWIWQPWPAGRQAVVGPQEPRTG